MAAKRRPRDYAALDREYLSQDTVQDLGDEFGPAGPLVLLALILEAGKATAAATAGCVELRYSPIARLTFTPVDKVKEIVARLVPLGLLGEFQESQDGLRFRGRMLKFERWETSPKSPAERKADQRAREAAD